MIGQNRAEAIAQTEQERKRLWKELAEIDARHSAATLLVRDLKKEFDAKVLEITSYCSY